MTFSKELSTCKLDVLGAQEDNGTKPAGEHTFLYGEGNENHKLYAGFFVHMRIMSAVRRVQFVSDRGVIHNIKRSLVSYPCSDHSRPNTG
jgi:hypothetical protein